MRPHAVDLIVCFKSAGAWFEFLVGSSATHDVRINRKEPKKLGSTGTPQS